jgi:pimeloyl-ACP methyl ester carboxylesterase
MHSDPETVFFPSGDLELHGRLRCLGDDAPTFVLLSGVGFHTFEYEPIAERLAAAGLNCLSFDFRGHGRSGGPRGRWLLDQLVADTRHAIDFVRSRCAGAVGLFGNSLGAMVAILTGAADDRVLGVAAANCPARIADFLLTGPRNALFAVAKLLPRRAPVRISLKHFYAYHRLIDDPSWISSISGDQLITDARRLSVATFSTLLDDWNGPSAVGDLHVPLLLIQGENDHLQPPQQSRILFEAANEPKEYRAIGTGHLPHLEDPAGVARLLAGWFVPLAGGATS